MATRTITFSILVLCLSGTKLSAQVTAGTRLQSPDHRFVVACRVGEQISPAVGLIEIIDAGTAKKLCSFEIDAPLYALKWTANSKTIIAVHHVSGGTIAQIIHLTSGKWSSFRAAPPIGDEATVIKLVPKNQLVELAYKVNQKPASSHPGKFYVCAFVVDPETAIHSDQICREIDLNTYRRLSLQY